MKIIEGSSNDLKFIYSKYKRDFPADERKEKDQIELLMLKNKYKLLIAKDTFSSNVLGYAFVYETEDSGILWIDYIAIDIEFQSRGYGTVFFNKIMERNKDVIGIMVEVEKAEHEDYEIRDKQNRRISFYKRLGAHKLKINYKLPTKESSIPLDLYFVPKNGVRHLSKERIQNKICSVFEFIHGDIPHRYNVMRKFIEEIEDEYFHSVG